jgi:hypothetical protein
VSKVFLVDTTYAKLSRIIEFFYLQLVAKNPLNAPLSLGGLRIEVKDDGGVVEIDAPQEIELAPFESQHVRSCSSKALLKSDVNFVLRPRYLFRCGYYPLAPSLLTASVFDSTTYYPARKLSPGRQNDSPLPESS